MIKNIFYGIFIIYLSGSNVFASFSSHVALENNIQNRVSSILKPMDNSSFVIVDLKFKRINVRLPGTSIQQESIPLSGLSDSFSSNDIEKIDVQVFTKLDPFPEEIKNIIKTATQLSNVKVNITYQKIDDLTSDLIQENEPIQIIKSKLSETKGYISLFVFGFIFLFLVFTVMSIFFLYKFKSIFEKSVQNLVLALGENAGGGGSQRPVVDVENAVGASSARQNADSSQAFLPQSLNPFQEFSMESIRALFTDCYWCQEDAYALWIWNRLSGEQKLLLFEKWTETENYIRSISTLGEKNLQLHLHPAYLKPFSVCDTSQEDLAEWLKKNQGVWSFLSPLRQLHCPVSLEERMKYLSATPLISVDKKPPKSKKMRIFESTFVVNYISEEDENKILENSALIPQQHRKNIPSLVWLALLPLEERRSLLEDVSAGELAVSWSASASILEKLSEALPEKKLILLKSYLEKSTPQRNSKTFKVLVSRALERLEKTEPVSEQTPLKDDSSAA